jgi:5'(3')-deoxyribonucleotidase
MTPKPGSKKIIAVDVDDVLAANAEGFAEFSNSRWGTQLTPDDYTEHWAEIWGISQEETEERRQEIIRAKVFTKHRFFDEAKPVLRKLSRHFDLVVVSSRGQLVQKDTVDWLKEEYGEIFSALHFADMWDRYDLKLEERLKGTKTDILVKIGAAYLIDDQPKHCLAAAEAGITAVLYGDYKWNRDTKLLRNMVRAKNWKEVLEYFEHEAGQ